VKRVIPIILALCAAAAQAQQQTTLTFHQALERALEVNNSVERARADVKFAEANKQQLLSNVLPRITATGNAIRNSTQVSFGSGSDARTILPQNDWSYRVVLSQPVFAGRRELRAYSQAKLGVVIAQLGELGTEDAVLLRVASNYLALVSADARIEVEKRNIDLSEKRRAQANAFFQAGEVTKVDVLRAETAIKASQRQLAVAEESRENAASRLRADLNLDGAVVVAPPDHPMPPAADEAVVVAGQPRVQHARPSIDVLFESAADAYRERTVGVVLTGANRDGAAGLARIKELGGVAIVQSPHEALAHAMPRAALAATPEADAILPLDEIPLFLTGLCLNPQASRR